MTVTRPQIVAEARAFIGTRWEHQGRLRNVGVDCIGLIYEVARALGLDDGVQLPPYARRSTDNMMQQMCQQYLVRVGGPAEGRIATLRFSQEIRHMGFIGDYPAGGFSLIHSYAKVRKVVEHRLDDLWLQRCTAFYDFPSVQ